MAGRLLEDGMKQRKSWQGAVFFSERALAYLGPITSTELHSHHAVPVAIGFTAPLTFEDERATLATGRSFVIPPDAPHAIHSGGELALLVFVDAEAAVGWAIKSRLREPGVLEWRRAA